MELTLSKITFRIYFIPVLLLLCITNWRCNENSKDVTSNTNITKTDSVFIWLAEIRKNEITLEKRDSLFKKAYQRAIASDDDTLKVRYFSRMQWIFMNLEDSLRFRKLNKEFREITIAISDSSRLAGSYWDLAAHYGRKGLQDSAYYAYGNAYKIYGNLGEKEKELRMLIRLAAVQADINDYTGSEVKLTEAVRRYKALNSYSGLYRSYSALGSVANGLQNYDEALNDYKTASFYLEKSDLNDPNTKYNLLNQIGVVYRDMGDYKAAISHFKNILDNYSNLKTDDTFFYTTVLNNYASSKFKNNDFSGVENMLLEALYIRDSLNLPRRTAASHYDLAEFYLAQKDTTKALDHASKAVADSKKSSNNKRLLLSLRLLPSIDPSNAVNYSEAYIQLRDSLRLQELKIRNKFGRIELETEEVKAENQVLAQKNLMWIGIASALFLLAGGIWTILSLRSRNQKLKFEQEQQAANQEIFELMLNEKQKVEEGKQAEQQRISEELHDSVVGQMHSVRMLLLGLNKKADDTAIQLREDAINKLRDVQEEVRTISHELNDAAYQKIHNFINSVQEQLIGFEKSTGLKVKFDYSDSFSWDALSGETKINLYRVIQESLQNSTKHSKAKTIGVNLDADQNLVYLKISDDGIGFNPKKEKKGIGHKNISSRIKKLSGTWHINSQLNKGTIINVQIPHHIKQNAYDNEPSVTHT